MKAKTTATMMYAGKNLTETAVYSVGDVQNQLALLAEDIKQGIEAAPAFVDKDVVTFEITVSFVKE